MLKSLLKINLYAALNWLTGGGKRAQNAKAGKKAAGKGKLVLYAALMLYALGVLGWVFGMVFELLCEPLYLAGCGWLYFIYVFILAFALMFVFNVFTAKNKLYEAKDNDLLLSMPIPTSYILCSRMMLLFGINLVTGLLVVVPAVIVWFGTVPFDPVSFVFTLLIFLSLALFALAVSSLFGWLLSLASSKINKKALLETVLSLLFLGAYFIAYYRINDIVQNLLTNNESIAETMGAIMPLYRIGAGSTGDPISFLISLLMLLVPFAAVYYILSRTFIKTATRKRGMARIKYEATEQKVSSVGNALLKREFRRFFSSSTCIINNGFGFIFLTVGAVAVLIYSDKLFAVLGLDPTAASLVLAIAILSATLLAGMVVSTSSSVALEGKSIWIVQSMPVSPADVLKAKLRLCLTLNIPPILLFMVCCVMVLKPTPSLIPLAILLPSAAYVVMAEIGLISNVNHPALNWTTESQAVKSGVAVLLCMLYDLAIVAAMGILGFVLLSNGLSLEIVLSIFLVVMLIAARLLYKHICTRCALKFAYLS